MDQNLDLANALSSNQESASHHVGASGDHGEDSKSTGVFFFPPLYAKRYSLAVEILKKHEIKSVIDFGCSECNFVKGLSTVPTLEAVALVDIDRQLLISKQRTIAPEMRHFIFKRRRPLHVSLLAGSAEETDSRFADYEAVTMIELIEHLYPDVLGKVTHNVFSNIKPKVCIVTTPNSEFNVLFKNSDPTSFRHWDHKFEWNREEFKSWCEDICKRYDYTVEYTGVGLLSDPETHHLGYCSQAAIFSLRDTPGSHQKLPADRFSKCYELIAEQDYPFEQDVASTEEKIDLEVNYCVQFLASSIRNESTSEDIHVALPLSRILNFPNVKALLCDEAAIRESLLRSSFQLSEDKQLVYIPEEENADEDFENVNNEKEIMPDKSAPEECVSTCVESLVESWD